VALEDLVVLALLVEGELVLKAGAATTAHATRSPATARSASCPARNSCTFSAPLSLMVIIASLPWIDSKTFQSIVGRDCRPQRTSAKRIEAAIPGARAEVDDYTGGGDHFRATVTASAFEGRSRLEQHRLVYEVFGAEIGGPIHALALKLLALKLVSWGVGLQCECVDRSADLGSRRPRIPGGAAPSGCAPRTPTPSRSRGSGRLRPCSHRPRRGRPVSLPRCAGGCPLRTASRPTILWKVLESSMGAKANDSPSATRAPRRCTSSSQGRRPTCRGGLRVGVRGGGLLGFQYQLAFDEQRENDEVFESHGLKLLVDRESLQFVRARRSTTRRASRAPASRSTTPTSWPPAAVAPPSGLPRRSRSRPSERRPPPASSAQSSALAPARRSFSRLGRRGALDAASILTAALVLAVASACGTARRPSAPSGPGERRARGHRTRRPRPRSDRGQRPAAVAPARARRRA